MSTVTEQHNIHLDSVKDRTIVINSNGSQQITNENRLATGYTWIEKSAPDVGRCAQIGEQIGKLSELVREWYLTKKSAIDRVELTCDEVSGHVHLFAYTPIGQEDDSALDNDLMDFTLSVARNAGRQQPQD